MAQQVDASVHGVTEGASLSNQLYYYAVTYKPTFRSYIKKIKQDEKLLFKSFIELFYSKRSGIVMYKNFKEYDSKRVPHLHATISVPYKLDYIECQVKGFHLYFKQLEDDKNMFLWDKYIQKDVDDGKNGYLFIDDK